MLILLWGYNFSYLNKFTPDCVWYAPSIKKLIKLEYFNILLSQQNVFVCI